MDNTERRRRSDAVSAAMKRRAEARKCAACQRKNATRRVSLGIGFGVVVVCRYCKHERAAGG